MAPQPDAFHVYDTTLRDGAQGEGMALTVADKLAIAQNLDDLGVGFIEGGWPGALPKDTEFFRRARTELKLKNATLSAFGATRKADVKAADDPQVAALRDSEAPVVCLVAKSHDRHVFEALKTTLDENLAMIRDTVEHLRGEGRRVFLDAEHFFDGYKANPAYAVEAVRVAAEAGADVIVLCDTNGGMLPTQLADVVHTVLESSGARLGIHTHDDTGCAVANTLAAVEAGVTHVQGVINGYGERCGNANLVTVVANLELKLGRRVLPDDRVVDLGRVSHVVAEIANQSPRTHQPYVGLSAFAHKGGLHASAIKVSSDLYQHVDPALVGNDMRMLVSEMAGRASVEMKSKELGFDLSNDKEVVGRVVDRVKAQEAKGYMFEAADASFELLLRAEINGEPVSYFTLESWRVIVERRADGQVVSEATVKVEVEGRAHRVDRRGQRSGERARPGFAARPRAPLSAARRARAGRLQGAHPRRRARHRRDHPGADRDQRRQDRMGHHRRRREPDRGVVAGDGGRVHVRAAAPALVLSLCSSRRRFPRNR